MSREKGTVFNVFFLFFKRQSLLTSPFQQLPDDLPFEDILVTAEKIYNENDPTDLEDEVAALEKRE